MRATARSISRTVREGLRRSPDSALRVLAVFERACDLVGAEERGSPHPNPPPRGEGRRCVIGLVTPEIGDGPLNVVLDRGGWDFAAVDPGTRAQVDGRWLRIGSLEVDLGEAEVWEPRPDWAALRKRRAAVLAQLPKLYALGLARARAGSLLTLLDRTVVRPLRTPASDEGQPGLGGGRFSRFASFACGNPLYGASREVSGEDLPRQATLAATRSAVRAMDGGWGGDVARLQEGAAQLAGLGGGLTPAGDDFVCGAMLWAWLAHPSPGSLCRIMVEAAAPRTTTLSAAFLRAAAKGECSAAWHALLGALARGRRCAYDARLDGAALELLMHGATSGADALAGFLWAGIE